MSRGGPLEWYPDEVWVPRDIPIKAEVHSDDRVHEVKFDARPFFEAAEDDEIIALADADWGGDYAADEVAIYMAENVKDKRIERLFEYLHEVGGRRNSPGFEVHVDHEDALEWIRWNRPHLLLHESVSRFL